MKEGLLLCIMHVFIYLFMTTFNDVIEYWTINNLDQSNTLLLLLDAFDDLGIDRDADDLKELLSRIADGYKYISEDEARIIITTFEKNVHNINYLKKIACILAGENIENTYDSLEVILFKYNWSLPDDVNIFICWYYRLSRNNDYIFWVKKSFFIYKIIMLLKAFSFILGTLFVFSAITRFSVILFTRFFPSIMDLFIVLSTTVNLIIGIMIILLSTYKFKFFMLVQFNIKFKKYIV